MVAPLAGAWIEIGQHGRYPLSDVVAPLAGAWIEIGKISAVEACKLRRSPRGSVD